MDYIWWRNAVDSDQVVGVRERRLPRTFTVAFRDLRHDVESRRTRAPCGAARNGAPEWRLAGEAGSTIFDWIRTQHEAT